MIHRPHLADPVSNPIVPSASERLYNKRIETLTIRNNLRSKISNVKVVYKNYPYPHVLGSRE
jgi:hypothetical protein